jgi:LmbE family N-acetylglucosaminyl deacetylase
VARSDGSLAARPTSRRTREKPESQITHRVEAVDFVEQKLAAMRVHAGQMGPDHFLLALQTGKPSRGRANGTGGAAGLDCGVGDGLIGPLLVTRWEGEG